MKKEKQKFKRIFSNEENGKCGKREKLLFLELGLSNKVENSPIYSIKEGRNIGTILDQVVIIQT